MLPPSPHRVELRERADMLPDHQSLHLPFSHRVFPGEQQRYAHYRGRTKHTHTHTHTHTLIYTHTFTQTAKTHTDTHTHMHMKKTDTLCCLQEHMDPQSIG